MKLIVRPIVRRLVDEHIARLHRHHEPLGRFRFAMGAWAGERLAGVVVVSRPVARLTDPQRVAEVSRLCSDGTHNVCSLLYSAAARAADAMGFEVIQTFILDTETGRSLDASGWKYAGMSKGGKHERRGRPRNDTHPLGPKQRWVKVLTNGARTARAA